MRRMKEHGMKASVGFEIPAEIFRRPENGEKSMQKIFVIEDDENIRNLVKIAMEGYGYQVASFETAEEALEALDKEKPDLAVFDLMLPGMDGLSAIRLIRANGAII